MNKSVDPQRQLWRDSHRGRVFFRAIRPAVNQFVRTGDGHRPNARGSYNGAEIRRQEFGFTLIELLTTIVISGIVLPALLIVLVSGIKSYARLRDSQAIVRERSLFYHQLERDIHSARQILRHGSQFVSLWINDDNRDGFATREETVTYEIGKDGISLYRIQGDRKSRVLSNAREPELRVEDNFVVVNWRSRGGDQWHLGFRLNADHF